MTNILGTRFCGLLLAVFAGASAFAGTVSFTCDATVDAAHAGTCATLNGTIAGLYNSVFSNANASVYIQMGVTDLGESSQFLTSVSYSSYYNALQSHEVGINDAIALASLGGGSTNPLVSGDDVTITSAMAAALALTGGTGTDSSGNSCTLGNLGCYNGVITITHDPSLLWYRSGVQPGGAYDFYSVVEHEVDEILGTSSCITTVASAPALSSSCTDSTAAADLFRYSGTGTRSFVAQGNGTTAYFSINGGVTNIAGYNNSPNGADYGDWDSASLRVQNAFGTPGVSTDITTDGGFEIAVLDAVGYEVNAPEPGTIAMFGSGLALLVGISRRRTRKG